jgi:nucleoside-diphosphate-sugar epimerase
VRRVVVASSNHAADYWEPMILDGGLEGIGPDAPALSDNYYGWAKQACEHLGFVFAVGRETGGPLENVQIRIGGATEAAVARCGPGEARRLRRALAVYVSARDLQQLIIKSIETEDIRDERGVPFQIFYGISNNARAFWSIASARRVVGYEPQDDSEERFAEQIPTS